MTAAAADKRLTRADLSPDQRAAYESILDWIKSGHSKSILSLGGVAGSGKSTLMGLLAAETELLVAYICFTGRASSILGRKLHAAGVATTNRAQTDDERRLSGRWGHLFYSPFDTEAIQPFCGTIHRLVYRPVIDEGTEELMGWMKREQLDRDYDLIVIDECFDYRQRVLTEDGWDHIGRIVTNRIRCRVWSYSKTGELELKPITRWLRKPAPKTLLRIDAGRTDSMRSARIIRCTTSHKILTPHGYIRAGALRVGDEVIVRGRGLTPLQFSVLVGSMLGDGSMNRHADRNSPQPMFMQGHDQIEWLKFKKTIFGEDMTGELQKGKSGYGKKPVWRFALNVTDQARRVSEEMRFCRRRKGRRYWAPTDTFLSWIDPVALAVWYLDDGSLLQVKGRITGIQLHTECFDRRTNERICGMLHRNFNLQAQVRQTRGYCLLALNVQEAKRLLKIVTPYIPSCMTRKAPGARFKPVFESARETTTAPIRSINVTEGRRLRGAAHVYDLEIADNHNYIAGNIVVSNCSMVPDDMLTDITRHGVRVLAVGDHGQLPPVRGVGSLMQSPDLRLEKIHRQAEGSPIIRLSRVIREEARMDRSLADGRQLVFGSAADLRRRVLVDVAGARPLDVAFLCWRNATREHINRSIREYRGFGRLPPQTGEPVICLRNYPPIYNGMRGVLTEPTSYPYADEWWLLRARVEFPDEGIEPEDYEVCRDQFHRHETFKSIDELRAAGIKVYAMSEAGRLFDFGYAMTIHKSQGSQFPHAVVVVDWKPNYQSELTRRLAYTAVTRAADKLTVLT